jgi:hypothetical protein
MNTDNTRMNTDKAEGKVFVAVRPVRELPAAQNIT